MIIVIRKEEDAKFVAFVADPQITFTSDFQDLFEPFRDGIVADGSTWGEAFENIKKQINKYLSAHMRAMGDVPEFVKNGVANIVSENTTLDDLMK